MSNQLVEEGENSNNDEVRQKYFYGRNKFKLSKKFPNPNVRTRKHKLAMFARTRDERNKEDCTAAITHIFDKLIGNYQRNFSFGSYTTIDEMLVNFEVEILLKYICLISPISMA